MGGGTDKSVLDRLAALEQKIEDYESRMATEETAGLVKLSASRSVTSSTGLAVPASELNAAIEGTLANGIQKISDTIEWSGVMKRFAYINPNGSSIVRFDVDRAYLLTITGGYNVSVLWLVMTGSAVGKAVATAIASNSYFRMEGNDMTSVKVTAGNASGWLCGICLAR